MIETDFAYLHDEFYIEQSKTEGGQFSQHTFYQTLNTNYDSVFFKDKYVFNHHIMNEADVQAFARRIRRLLKIVFNSELKLFVMTSTDKNTPKLTEYPQFQKACTDVYLAACSKYNNFDFVCVYLYDGPVVPCGSISTKQHTKISFWKAKNIDFIR